MTSRNAAHAKGAAWPILICMGSISITFCIYHDIHSGHMNPFLAILAGFAPSAVAVGLSHVVAAHNGGWAMKVLTVLVMASAMTLSAYPIAVIVGPAEGPDLKWIFGAVLDTASMVALWVIFDTRGGSTERTLEGSTQGASERTMTGATEGSGSRSTTGSGSGSTDGSIEGPRQGPFGGPPDGPSEGPLEGPESGPAESPVPDPAAPQGPPSAARERVSRYSHDPDAEKARAEYRRSVRRGQPLSDRALAAMFPGRSRNWAKARIREAKSGPQLAKAQGA